MAEPSLPEARFRTPRHLCSQRAAISNRGRGPKSSEGGRRPVARKDVEAARPCLLYTSDAADDM
eukprot:13253775-Alexandrium_andersonii.AAC.1